MLRPLVAIPALIALLLAPAPAPAQPPAPAAAAPAFSPEPWLEDLAAIREAFRTN